MEPQEEFYKTSQSFVGVVKVQQMSLSLEFLQKRDGRHRPNKSRRMHAPGATVGEAVFMLSELGRDLCKPIKFAKSAFKDQATYEAHKNNHNEQVRYIKKVKQAARRARDEARLIAEEDEEESSESDDGESNEVEEEEEHSSDGEQNFH